MTTQDKPAVGPLSAGDLVQHVVAKNMLRVIRRIDGEWPDVWLNMVGEPHQAHMADRWIFVGRPGPDGWISWSGGENPVPGQVVDATLGVGSFTNCKSDVVGPFWADSGRFRLAPTAPAEDVSTKPLETNTSAGRVKETGKNEHVTAAVEAESVDKTELSLLRDAEIALKVLCAKYGYHDDNTPKDWSEWVEAQRVHTAIRKHYLSRPIKHVTAQVEAGGSEPVEVTIFCPKCATPHVDEGEWATTRHHKTHQCQSCGHEWRPFPFATVGVPHPALRPQPSGETLQSLAQAFEGAMEGTHGAWAVSGDEGQAGDSDAAKLLAYEDAHQVALELGYPSLTEALEHLADLNPPPSGETREAVAARIRRLVSLADADFSFVAREAYVSKETDAILALIHPAAPGGGLADLAARVTAEVKRGADGSHVQALGALSNIEAMVRAAIPASEGGEG